MLARELFISALRKCGGIIAEGEAPSEALMEDTRSAFNVMLDSWSAERLSVFSTQDQTLTWPAGEATQTVGPTGDLVGSRPQKLHDSTYFKDPGTGISYNFKIINEQQYNSIALKTATSTYPDTLWINNTMPDSTITLYPVPNQNIEIHLISVVQLEQVDDLSDTITLPPGYLRALIYNLACEIAPELGVAPPPTTQRLAMATKRVLKANNSPQDVMSFPSSLVGGNRRFNIYSGDH